MLYEYNGPVRWNAHGLKMEKYNEFCGWGWEDYILAEDPYDYYIYSYTFQLTIFMWT